MHIEEVSAHSLSSPIDPVQERSFAGGTRRLRKRDVVVVIVETADGERGIAPAGASSSAMREYFEDSSHATFADVVDDRVADILAGVSIDGVTEATERLQEANLPGEILDQAISAIDVALHDIAGKEAGAPIYELLADSAGTTPTTDLPMYASAGMYMEPDGYVEQASLIDEAGFFGYKYRPGIGPAGDREIVEKLAETIDCEIMIDAHTWWKIRTDDYDAETVLDLIKHAGDAGAYWVEEPVAPDDYEGYQALAGRGVRLAGGESEHNPAGLLALADTGAVSFLQGDVRHHHGFIGCWTAVERCRGTDIAFVPHNFGTWLGLVANAHLVAAAPEAELLEYPVFENDPTIETDGDPGMYPFQLAFDILEDAPRISDGVFRVPDGPGLGVELDMSVIDRYPYIDGPWTEFRYDAST